MSERQREVTWQFGPKSFRGNGSPLAGYITIFTALTICVTALSRAEALGNFQGWLLVALVAIIGAAVTVFCWMSVRSPQNLTFDKEAHLKVGFDLQPTERVNPRMLEMLIQDLIDAKKDPDRMESLAKMLNAVEAPKDDEAVAAG